MERYENLGGDSGVSAYEIGEGSISVRFNDGATYLYTDESAGSHHILRMQQLAIAGDGLNSYIMRHVRTNYASKSRF